MNSLLVSETSMGICRLYVHNHANLVLQFLGAGNIASAQIYIPINKWDEIKQYVDEQRNKLNQQEAY